MGIMRFHITFENLRIFRVMVHHFYASSPF